MGGKNASYASYQNKYGKVRAHLNSQKENVSYSYGTTSDFKLLKVGGVNGKSITQKNLIGSFYIAELDSN